MKILVFDCLDENLIAIKKELSKISYVITVDTISIERNLILKGHLYDLLIINIDYLDDFNIIKELKSKNTDLLITLISKDLNYVLEAFKYEIFDYILYPINPNILSQSAIRAHDKINKFNDIINIKLENHKDINVNIYDIYYIENYNRHIIYHLFNNKSYKTVCLRKSFFDSIPFNYNDSFIKVNQNIIINQKYIKSLGEKKVISIFKEEFDVAPKYHKEVKDKFLENILK